MNFENLSVLRGTDNTRWTYRAKLVPFKEQRIEIVEHDEDELE